ncbi:nucleotidyltransferase domain-containing protein [Candidatus Woesearchaeota archaeon]|nr:nucleotidyltransferase domain-containing protein [Candidatus Woesearchaeota archaeon]
MDNSARILLYLAKNRERTFTMHGLAKELGIPYMTFHRTIKRIAQLLTITTIGRAKTLALKHQDILASHLAIASWQERKEFLNNNPLIDNIQKELTGIALLFGSYAKGTATATSDIDLLLIDAEKHSFTKHETLYKKKINPMFITKEEFVLMLKERDENVAKQALKHHIVLKNAAAFWKTTL